MLEKNYTPQQVEQDIYAQWVNANIHVAHNHSTKPSYTIMMPPPNVTGSLHIGHALTMSIQDCLIRYHRQKGYNALWLPGQDHAGIATQMVVERELAKEGKVRKTIGREAFLTRVWQWKEQSGGTIINQLKALGALPDWSRMRFTLDEGLNLAVRKLFVELYEKGLIYRAQSLVNWDPKLKTAISDLEVETKEINSHLWHLKYPVKDSLNEYIIVATTRPETMLGDSAVAVNPEDVRYQHLIGKEVCLPLTTRTIPIIADSHADPEAGSGAVKITPAHDFNDFVVGKRHNLPLINILDEEAHLNENVPEKYHGLERFAARKLIVEDLQALGLIEKIEPHKHSVPHGDRSGAVIEPYLTDQWYVKADILAKPALEAVEQGKTTFFPKLWEKTYFEWLRNIQPWCISRQLWWGHRIPAWYGPDGKIFVAHDEDEAQEKANIHYGKPTILTQDEDVLDTWFSSGLWPFSTLGWPEINDDLKQFYPGDVLVTGFDIIFFWVARMMMMGIYTMEDIPFRHIYIHPLIRDAKGQKMSKTKGNVIDPLTLIDKYGADAVRFTLLALAAQGNDIKLGENAVEQYKHFITKLWNATRFCLLNGCTLTADYKPENNQFTLNQWIISELITLQQRLEQAYANYKFNEIASALYTFFWTQFCDWYLEMVKPLFTENTKEAMEAKATTAFVLRQVLMLMHPITPFVTEMLWEKTKPVHEAASLLAQHERTALSDGLYNESAIEAISKVMQLISQIRNIRQELNIAPKEILPLYIPGALTEISGYEKIIARLARIKFLLIDQLNEAEKNGSAQVLLGAHTLYLYMAGSVNIAQEQERLRKELAKVEHDVKHFSSKLHNPNFTDKAPPHVIEEHQEKLQEAELRFDKLQTALTQLKQMVG